MYVQILYTKAELQLKNQTYKEKDIMTTMVMNLLSVG